MRLSLAVLSLLLALAASNAAAATSPLFFLDTDEATYIRLFLVDPASGQLTTVGSLDPSVGVDLALAAASDNLLYSVTQSGEVLQIVPVPFAVTSLGNVGANAIVGLAYADGQLYAEDESNNALYRIQLSPLSITTVGTVHLSDMSTLSIQGGDIAEDASGTWYLWTNSTQALYLLDVTTATATPVASQMTGLGALTGLAVNYLGGDALLGSSSPQHALVMLDPNSGATISSVNFCCVSGGPSCGDTMCPAVYQPQAGDLASPQPSTTSTTTTVVPMTTTTSTTTTTAAPTTTTTTQAPTTTTTTMAPITTTTKAPTTTTSTTSTIHPTTSTSTTSTTTTSATSTTVPTQSNACLVAFHDSSGTVPPNGTLCQVATGNVCAFNLQLCLNEPEQGCTPATFTQHTFRAMGHCGPVGLLRVDSMGTDSVCGAFAGIKVHTRSSGKRPGQCTIRAAVRSAKTEARTDLDTLTLVCVPPSDRCPTTTTVP